MIYDRYGDIQINFWKHVNNIYLFPLSLPNFLTCSQALKCAALQTAVGAYVSKSASYFSLLYHLF